MNAGGQHLTHVEDDYIEVLRGQVSALQLQLEAESDIQYAQRQQIEKYEHLAGAVEEFMAADVEARQNEVTTTPRLLQARTQLSQTFESVVLGSGATPGLGYCMVQAAPDLLNSARFSVNLLRQILAQGSFQARMQEDIQAAIAEGQAAIAKAGAE